MHIGYYELLNLCRWHANKSIDDVLDEHPTVDFDSFTEDELKNFLVKHY